MKQLRQGLDESTRVGGVAPTERKDGTPLGPVTFFRFSSFDGGAVVEEEVGFTDGFFDGTMVADDMAVGLYVYHYQVEGEHGIRSDDSEVLSLEVLPPFAKPNPPTGLFFS